MRGAGVDLVLMDLRILRGALALALALATPAGAQEIPGLERGVELRSHRDIVRVCDEARVAGRRLLYEVVAGRFRFGRYDEETGLLPVDFSRNLRVLRGMAELHPAGLVEVGFRATPESARELMQSRAVARLRIGFFLGFDGRGQSCIVRNAHASSLLRADVAYLELVDGEDRVIARQDTEILRAWRDDASSQNALVVEAPRLERGQVDLGALRAAVRGQSEVLVACIEAAHERGAPPTADFVLRFETDESARTRVSVALSSLGESEGTECIRAAVAGLSLSTASGGALVPIQLTVQRAMPRR